MLDQRFGTFDAFERSKRELFITTNEERNLLMTTNDFWHINQTHERDNVYNEREGFAFLNENYDLNGMERSDRCSQNEPRKWVPFSISFFFEPAPFLCVWKWGCVLRSNQNDKRSSRRFFGCTQRSRIPTLFSFCSTLRSLFFVCLCAYSIRAHSSF